jgi:hypothetical protein
MVLEERLGENAGLRKVVAGNDGAGVQ